MVRDIETQFWNLNWYELMNMYRQKLWKNMRVAIKQLNWKHSWQNNKEFPKYNIGLMLEEQLLYGMTYISGQKYNV